MSTFRYDVAISFLSTDERLASSLAEALAGRATVFIYTERQRELAGTDGLEEFSKAFGRDSRVCVVFYREGWGETQWTRVEAAAIKERGLRTGWDFLLAISLDGGAPIWLPRSQLWLQWERFGLSAAVAVVERKITEGGGILHDPTPVERAAQLAAAGTRQAEIQRRLQSTEGVALAKRALTELFEHLDSQIKAITQFAPKLRLTFGKRPDGRVAAVSSPGFSVTLVWSQQFGSTLQYSSLVIRQIAGPYYLDGSAQRKLTVLDETAWCFTLDADGQPAWQSDDTSHSHGLLSSKQLAERHLHLVIGHADDEPPFEDDGVDAFWQT